MKDTVVLLNKVKELEKTQNYYCCPLFYSSVINWYKTVRFDKIDISFGLYRDCHQMVDDNSFCNKGNSCYKKGHNTITLIIVSDFNSKRFGMLYSAYQFDFDEFESNPEYSMLDLEERILGLVIFSVVKEKYSSFKDEDWMRRRSRILTNYYYENFNNFKSDFDCKSYFKNNHPRQFLI